MLAIDPVRWDPTLDLVPLGPTLDLTATDPSVLDPTIDLVL